MRIAQRFQKGPHDTVENIDVTRQARLPPHTAYGLEWRGNRNELHHHPANMQLTTVIVKTFWETSEWPEGDLPKAGGVGFLEQMMLSGVQKMSQ